MYLGNCWKDISFCQKDIFWRYNSEIRDRYILQKDIFSTEKDIYPEIYLLLKIYLPRNSKMYLQMKINLQYISKNEDISVLYPQNVCLYWILEQFSCISPCRDEIRKINIENFASEHYLHG